ncbi:MAG: hypothetical protein AUJ92_07395 [Armatimonadetes bacterium CG2_30_59_28]|nr:hypothetical protein [Armatimonadota bacterium]OIO95834.1 MAG: hypothetical protein AUJ92_07395 [Armatimonadetes bacterium CG2_30_59_28]PIU64026.1 MAG: hypothetical protein COS85_14035 [Armatimonadetes bacterium CG07_land_8_20_14_0_80_59_28]PIY48033.1 MAG: hypothetical protein COZ05_04305 [Armatimonadetes bacterium CG_4_10_14_3_um_filter_59_10]
MTWREKLTDKSIYIVPVCHADWAWTHTRQWHEERYALVFEDVLKLLRDNPDFRWYIEQENEQFAVFRERCPELWDELREQVRAGRIGIAGATSAMRPSVYDPEVFVRNMILGRRYFAQLFPEADLSVYINTDTAGAHGQIPQLVALAGYECYRWWRPLLPLDLKGIPRTFRWRGMDGTVIHATRGTYGGLCSEGQVLLGSDQDWEQRVDKFAKPMDDTRLFDNDPSPVIWASQGGDDVRPAAQGAHALDAPLPFAKFVEEWNRRESIPMRFATPVEFYRTIENAPELPLVEDVSDPVDVNFNPPWAGERGLWRLRMMCERALLQRESLEVLAQWLNVDRDDAATSGLTYPPATPLDIDWHEAAALSAHAKQWAFQDDFDRLVARAEALLHRTQFRSEQIFRQISRRIPAPTAGGHAVIWNLHPRPRREVVGARFCFVETPPKEFKVLDAEGNEIPYQRIHEYPYFEDRIAEVDVLLDVDLPAGGYALMTAVEGTPDTPPPVGDGFTNGEVELTFDRGLLMKYERGDAVAIKGSYDKPLHDLAFLRYDQSGALHVGSLVGEERFKPTAWCVEENGPLRWIHRSEGFVGRHPAVVRTILHKHTPRVEFHTEIDCLGDGGLFVARFPIPGDAILSGDIPFGVESKDLSREAYGGVGDIPEWMTIERRRPGQFHAQSWVDAECGDDSRAVISLDGDKWWLLQQERGLLGHILFAAFQEPRHWEVNINQQIRAIGKHNFRYAFLPHSGDWRSANLPDIARRLRNPAFSFMRTRHGPGGDLESSGSLMEVSPTCVQLTALIPDEDACLARLVNLSDDSVEATLSLPFAVSAATAVDFMRNPSPGTGVTCEGKQAKLTMLPWKIVTLRIECEVRER